MKRFVFLLLFMYILCIPLFGQIREFDKICTYKELYGIPGRVKKIDVVVLNGRKDTAQRTIEEYDEWGKIKKREYIQNGLITTDNYSYVSPQISIINRDTAIITEILCITDSLIILKYKWYNDRFLLNYYLNNGILIEKVVKKWDNSKELYRYKYSYDTSSRISDVYYFGSDGRQFNCRHYIYNSTNEVCTVNDGSMSLFYERRYSNGLLILDIEGTVDSLNLSKTVNDYYMGKLLSSAIYTYKNGKWKTLITYFFSYDDKNLLKEIIHKNKQGKIVGRSIIFIEFYGTDDQR